MGEERELLSFQDYLVDMGITENRMMTASRLLIEWDIHGEPYMAYCEDNGYECEDLSNY